MYSRFKFKPALFTCLRSYTFAGFRADVSAGITVGIIALPMAMAFATASGVAPTAGLISGVIAGFLAAFFGGSAVGVGGPTVSFVAVVAGVGANYGLPGVFMCTMMAGVILFLMGFLRVGGLVKFIPAPLVKGFTTGMAVLILCGQIKDFIGIKEKIGSGSNLISTFEALLPHIGGFSLVASAIAVVSMACVFLWPRRIGRFIPGSSAVLILVTVICAAVSQYCDLDIATIGSRFGDIPRALPLPSWPPFDLEIFQNLLTPAATIALLGSIECLLCATAADGMIDAEHDPDQELMAQGIANFVVPFFGGIPSTGAMARTAANIRSGGRTPVAGMVHSLVLLFVLLVAAPLAKYIPMAVLAAILMVVGIRMGDWREFILLSRYPRSDAGVFLVTFFMTIIFGLTQAVMIGMIVSCLLFIRKISILASVGVLPTSRKRSSAYPAASSGESIADEMEKRDIADEVLVIRVNGAMFFGAAQKLKSILLLLKPAQKVLVLKMNDVISLDATAILTLGDVIGKCLKRGVDVIFCCLESQPRAALERAKLFQGIPEGNILDDLELALDRAEAILDSRKSEAA